MRKISIKQQIWMIITRYSALFLVMIYLSKAQSRELSDLIAQDIQKQGALVEVLPEHKFYHYFNYFPDQAQPTTPEERRTFLVNRLQNFSNLVMRAETRNNNSMAYGPGLYTAQDNFSFASYGRQAMQISIQSGKKYYLLKGYVKYSPETLHALNGLIQDSSLGGYTKDIYIEGPSHIFFSQLVDSNGVDGYSFPKLNNDVSLLRRLVLPHLLLAYKKLNIIGHLVKYDSGDITLKFICSNYSNDIALLFGLIDTQHAGQADVSMFDVSMMSSQELQNMSALEKNENEQALEIFHFISKMKNLTQNKYSDELSSKDVNALKRPFISCQ